jgi:hypothetical protein
MSVAGTDDGGGFGVYGRSDRPGGIGVLGQNHSGNGSGDIGVQGESTLGVGVWASSKTGDGVQGHSGSSSGVYGRSETGAGVYGHGDTGRGVVGESPSGDGVAGESVEAYGVYGKSGSGDAVYGEGDRGRGVAGYSYASEGVYGKSDTGTGVYGQSDSDSSVAYGVYGHSDKGRAGVYGQSHDKDGVFGRSTSGNGVIGSSGYGYGVAAFHAPGVGVAALYAKGQLSQPRAALLDGNVEIMGYLSKTSGGFKIDHPLDPANKYLYHSFVESPDMKNVYDGVVTLDDKGEAEIELPDWFGTLNKDSRYQLTAIGAPGPNLHIAEEISDYAATTSNYNNNKSRFKIAGGTSGMKVSWQVTGIRKDPWANAHRIRVEEDKPAKERGYYTFPELYGQPDEKGISRLHFPRDEEEKEKEEKDNVMVVT